MNIHSPIRSRPSSLQGTFLLFFNSKPSRQNSLGVPMDDGQNGLLRLSKSCIFSLKSLEQLVARYVSEYALLLRSAPSMDPHLYVSGITILEPDLCRNRRTPFSVYSYRLRARHIVTHTSFRQSKAFEQAKTLFSTSLDELKSFLHVSRFTQQCRRPRW